MYNESYRADCEFFSSTQQSMTVGVEKEGVYMCVCMWLGVGWAGEGGQQSNP